MAERYLDLAPVDRREVLDVAASASGRPVYLLEKDVWVVWSLATLFGGRLENISSSKAPVIVQSLRGHSTLLGGR